MLAQRIATALALLALLLPALFSTRAWPFAVLTLVMISAAGWEWARLNGGGAAAAIGFGLLVGATCGLAFAAGWAVRAPEAIWWLALVGWVIGGGLALRRGPAGWPALPRVARLAVGWLMLCVGWLALAQARGLGINFLLSVLCLVWAADIAAYFGGRRFGRHKLSPAISPGKSWEGVWSGMLGVGLLAALWIVADQRGAFDGESLYTRLWQHLGPLGLGAVLVFLAAMSVVGDLLESLVKRSAGAKDSSRLLPGHGGVLDRIDALLPVVPLALALNRY